jgi:heparan-alpha-glucosaminide N-acetyltransferase
VHAALVLVLWSAAGVLHAMLVGTVPGPAGIWGDAHAMAGEFDRWLFGALPRTVRYSVEAHRFYTLEFMPLVPNMLVGVAVGRALYRATPRARLAWPLIGTAIAGFAIAAALTLSGIPLVKSLWTPSWSVFSAACCALALALALWAFENPVRRRWAQPLAVLGANTVLLYVVAFVDRWRIVLYAERLIGAPLTASDLRPLLQSLVVLATLWVFAYALERARIRVSL